MARDFCSLRAIFTCGRREKGLRGSFLRARLGQRSGWGLGRGRDELGQAGAGWALATLGKFELRARAWASGACAAAFSGGAWGREVAGAGAGSRRVRAGWSGAGAGDFGKI